MASFVSGYMTEDGKFFEDSRDAHRHEMKLEFCRLYDLFSGNTLYDTDGSNVRAVDIYDWLTNMPDTQLTQFKAMARDLQPKDNTEDED